MTTEELRERLATAADAACRRQGETVYNWQLETTIDAVLMEIDRAGMVVVEAAMVERLRAFARTGSESVWCDHDMDRSNDAVVAWMKLSEADLGRGEG